MDENRYRAIGIGRHGHPSFISMTLGHHHRMGFPGLVEPLVGCGASGHNERNHVPSRIPTMRSLMEDPIFRAYMKRVPPAYGVNVAGTPWQIWVETPAHKWLTQVYPTYRDVWPPFVRKLRDPEFTGDVTITSRRVFYAPPGKWYRVKVRRPRRPTPDNPATTKLVIEPRWRQTFFWDGTDLHWCGRCRRPVYWMPLFANHHALRRMPAITEDDNVRCVLCGIRWITMPEVPQMVKMEAMP